MFYYLSFLRPPPISVAITSKQLLFTPQIANDLRTELYQVHVDIWYSWILSSHASSTKQEDFNQWTLQQPRKLTTWKGSSSAYTATPIGLPAGCKVGQSWRIGLWAMGSEKKQSDNPTTIELRAGSPHCGFGASVLPVVSSPVRITASEKKETSKQERILRRYAIHNTIAREGLEGDETGVDARRLVHIVEQTSFDLDKKVWDSGLGLSSWLADVCEATSNAVAHSAVKDLRDVLLGPNGFSAVELGSGIGVVSLLLACMLDRIPVSGRRHLVATDLASAMPLIAENVANNKDLLPCIALNAATLDWAEPLSACEPLTQIEHIDLVIMADVTYNRDSFDILLKTLKEITGGPGGCKRILLGYKERDPAERDLWRMAEGMGITFEMVGEVKGMGEPAVEIWIGSAE